MIGGGIILLQELCLLCNILICFGIPIVGVVLLSRKAGHMVKPFLVGMAAFIISQLVLRLPIIQYVLPNFRWFQIMPLYPYINSVFFGLTAGIFEETARLIFMKLCLKNRTRMEDGLAFGLGHGGIEAMVLVGINSIATMVLNPMGYIDLSGADSFSVFLGGYERLFTMMFHVGASLIVLHGIRIHKAGGYTILAILIHGFVDSMLGILPIIFGLGIIGLEAYISIISVLVLIFGCWLFVNPSHRTRLESNRVA